MKTETSSLSIRDDYDNIHHTCPGLFRDTISMDDPNEAFYKMKQIIKDLVNSQHTLKPMFEIEFTDFEDYPNYQERLMNIKEKIAKHRLF